MKLELLGIIVLGFFLLNCGKKEDPPPQTDQQQQNTQQQQNRQQTTQQTDTTGASEKKKAEELARKKEEEKKKAEEKRKKEEELKKKQDEAVGDDGSVKQEIDFAPIFAKRCAKCHGKDGRGKVEGVPNLTLPKTQNRSEKEIISIITTGKQGETEEDEDMPSFKNKLSEEEIKAAAKYVKGL